MRAVSLRRLFLDRPRVSFRPKADIHTGNKIPSAVVSFPGTGKRMAYYRLYFFRCETGRIREVREFEAPHDFAAIYQAAAWRSNESMELWSGSRKVTCWPATGLGAGTLVSRPSY